MQVACWGCGAFQWLPGATRECRQPKPLRLNPKLLSKQVGISQFFILDVFDFFAG